MKSCNIVVDIRMLHVLDKNICKMYFLKGVIPVIPRRRELKLTHEKMRTLHVFVSAMC